jgi:hypothetical protein
MNRLKEGSTWAALAAFIASLSAIFPHYGAVLTGAAGVAAAVGAAIPDKGAAK